MTDSYLYIIVALMPLAAVMLTLQVNPYSALVIRGILGAIAALIYAVLGAADVALTEALVGTMLAITLYVVAVRSSLVMRVGLLDHHELPETDPHHPLTQIMAGLRQIARKYHLRLELQPYPDLPSLQQALIEKDVHITCVERSHLAPSTEIAPTPSLYQTTTRVRRLYHILQTELTFDSPHLTAVTLQSSGENTQ